MLLRDAETSTQVLARIKVPKELLGRFIDVGGEDDPVMVPLEDVIASNIDQLFPGIEVVDYGYFRVTRDADFNVSDEADDLLEAVQEEIRRRRFGEVVRLEVSKSMDPALTEQLVEVLRLQPAADPIVVVEAEIAAEDFDALIRAARWSAAMPFIDPDGAGPLDRLRHRQTTRGSQELGQPHWRSVNLDAHSSTRRVFIRLSMTSMVAMENVSEANASGSDWRRVSPVRRSGIIVSA